MPCALLIERFRGLWNCLESAEHRVVQAALACGRRVFFA